MRFCATLHDCSNIAHNWDCYVIRMRPTLPSYAERNHQGKGNVLLFPWGNIRRDGPVHCRERLGGLLRYYHQEAA
jgi:hypothetical protein